VAALIAALEAAIWVKISVCDDSVAGWKEEAGR